MLHENAKQRLWRVVPREVDLTWFDPLSEETVDDTIELDERSQITWQRDDSPMTYPRVILGFDPQGAPRGELGHIFSDGVYKFPHADDEIAYTQYNAKPMTGDLHVTVAANSDHITPDGDVIPKRVVADSIGMEVFHAFQFETQHLEEQGVEPDGQEMDYAWPMRVRGIDTDGMLDTSTTIDEQAVQRRHMIFPIEYAYFAEREVPAVAKIQYDLYIDKNRDGDFTHAYSDEIDLTLFDDDEDDE